MATKEHCLACFEALDAELHRRKPLSLDEIQALVPANSMANTTTSPSIPLQDASVRRLAAESDSSASSSTSLAASTPATSTSSLPLPPTSAPLFVTWNIISHGQHSLRGCIGTFESQPLSSGLAEYALISAMHDTRFSPIRKSELPSLEVAVTLLTDFEEADDAYDWEVGTHGIRLSFYDRGRRYGATYLPDVALEQGWTQDEALFSLVRKAGWMGSRSHWKDLELKVTRYQGRKVSLTYEEYKEWREGIEDEE